MGFPDLKAKKTSLLFIAGWLLHFIHVTSPVASSKYYPVKG
jgi:hypothetical protein